MLAVTVTHHIVADLGLGGNGIEIRALAGQSFNLFGRDGFADIQTAWVYRSHNAPDTLKTDATIGLGIHENRQILAQVFYSQTGGQIIENDRILPNRYVKLQGSMVLKRSRKTSVQFGVFQTVAGRNIVQEKGVFAAVWRRY